MRALAPVVFLLLLIAAVVAALLGPHLYNYYIADDFWHLAFARFSLEPWGVWWRPFFADVFWRPLTISADVGIYALSGIEPLGNHLFDAILHGLNAFLVGLLAWLLGRASGVEGFWRWAGAYLAGLLFAVHPIGLLTASWLCCRADLLGGFFVLLSLVLFLGFGGRWWAAAGAGGAALLAALCKETMIVQPGLIFLAALSVPAAGVRGFRRLGRAGVAALPSLAAIGGYLYWRGQVLGGLGGYEPMEWKLSYFLPRLVYHLPRLLERAPRDLFFHHLDSADVPFRTLAVFFALLAVVAGWRVLTRRSGWLLLAVGWTVAAMAPLWNVSQMLVEREERLLYLAVIGPILLAAASLAALQKPAWRMLAVALWAVVFFTYALAGIPALTAWQQTAALNQALTVAVREKVLDYDPPPTHDRFYILGLDADQYYLDPMIKLALPADQLGNRFMLGDRPSLVWEFLPALSAPDPSPDPLPPETFPAEEVFFTDPQNRLVAATPPDLIFALQHDLGAKALEWKGGLMLDATAAIKELSFATLSIQNQYSYRRLFLPTWAFYRTGLTLSWTLSPDCGLDPADRSDVGMSFVAVGPDPYLLSPGVRFPAPGAAALEIELKVAAQDYLPADRSEAAFFWQTDEATGWDRSRELRFPIRADGEFHTYRLELTKNLAWMRSGWVRQVRLDPIAFPGRFWLRRILFLSQAEVAHAKAPAQEEDPGG